MKTMTVRKSGALICGALLASIATMAEPVHADPTVIGIQGAWNNGAGGVYTSISGVHTFGGPPTILPGSSAPVFTVTATSGLSTRPGFDFELVLDFANFGLFNNPPNIWWDTTLMIKPDTTPAPIGVYQVKNGAGAILQTVDLGSTPGTIRIRNLIGDFNLPGAADDKLIIQWTQIPAPGALALLGAAGAFGFRGRRRVN